MSCPRRGCAALLCTFGKRTARSVFNQTVDSSAIHASYDMLEAYLRLAPVYGVHMDYTGGVLMNLDDGKRVLNCFMVIPHPDVAGSGVHHGRRVC